LRLYRNKTKDTACLRTDDIVGAKPKQATRQRDPDAFVKMQQAKKTEPNGMIESSGHLRRSSKNLDHYHRMMSHLPGGLARWEGMVNSKKAGSSGVKDAMRHQDPSPGQASPERRGNSYSKSPYFREENSSPPVMETYQPREQSQSRPQAPAYGAKQFAAENSLHEVKATGKRQFGHPNISDIGINPERLPSLPAATRFRSPQPAKARDNHDMHALISHQDSNEGPNLFLHGRKGRGGYRPEITGTRAAEKEQFLNEYGKMKDELEFRREKGMIYRQVSPDNPLQMNASRRLNKSYDQSSQPNAEVVDYVKQVFDQSEAKNYQKTGVGGYGGLGGLPGTKGMFVVKRPGSRQTKDQNPKKADPLFMNNAGKFFE
jgi:hypothetical protein